MQKGPPISGRPQMRECKSASYETVIVPRMLACGVQRYLNMLLPPNVRVADSPWPNVPVSNAPFRSVAVWPMRSSLIHVMLSPTLISIFAGVNFMPLITTVWAVAWPSALASAAVRGREAMPAVRRSALRRVKFVMSISLLQRAVLARDRLRQAWRVI